LRKCFYKAFLGYEFFWDFFEVYEISLEDFDGFFLSCRNFYFLPSNFDPLVHLHKIENCLTKNKSYDMIERIHRILYGKWVFFTKLLFANELSTGFP
jgi:hypothetical protein